MKQEKLKHLMCADYCYVCYADLPQPKRASTHYYSLSHEDNVKKWKDKTPERIIQDKLELLTCLASCDICDVDFQQDVNAQSHYNSNRHRNHLCAWKNEEIKRLQPLKIYNSQEPAEKVSKTGVSIIGKDKILRDTLKSLICLDYCHICEVKLQIPENAKSHYYSKKHEKKVASWKKNELEERHTSSTILVEWQPKKKSTRNGSVLKPIVHTIQLEDIIETGTQSHYKPKRRKNNVFTRKSYETEKRHLSKTDSSFPKLPELVQVRKPSETVIGLSNIEFDETLRNKLKSLMCFDYCHICNANLQLPGTAQSHYKSKRHEKKLLAWKNNEIEKRHLPKTDNLVFKPVNELQARKISKTDKSPVEILRKGGESEEMKNLLTSKMYSSVTKTVEQVRIANTLDSGKSTKKRTEICSNYSYLSNVYLPEGSNIQSHYISNLHQNKLYALECEEMKLQPFKIKTSGSEIVEEVKYREPLDSDKSSHKRLPEKLESPISSNWYLSNANLPDVSYTQSHYNSNQHKNYLYDVSECEEVSKLQPSRMDSSVFKIVEQPLDSDKSPDKILEKKLESLICSNYCYLCNANLAEASNAQSHYNSNRHKINLYSWKYEERNKLKSDTSLSKIVKPVKGREPSDYDKLSEKILQEKLQTLIYSNYCYLCNANLAEASNARSHYNSNRHKMNIYSWKLEERNKLKSSRMDSSISKIVKPIKGREPLDYEKLPEKILQEKLQTLIYSNYCHLCNANLITISNARSHYDSKRHKNNLYTWKCEEINQLQASKKDRSVSGIIEEVKDRKALDPDELPNKILGSCSNYCFFCNAYFSNAQSHYNSRQHEENIYFLKPKLDRFVSKIPEQVQVENPLGTDWMINTNAIENSKKLNSTGTIEEMFHTKTEKLTQILKRIPPNEALKFLRKYVEELESFNKNVEAS